MRILLAEDDRLAQRTAALALQGAGHDVEVVADGEQAWARLLADPDRLLVTDWLMPNMDGIELIRRVRAGTFSSYVYTILVTALDDPSSVVRGLDAGADDHLGKPYDPRELVARVSVGERIVRLERELRASRGQLRDLATIDPLTGRFANPKQQGALRVWAYRDRPVYTFAGDRRPGDAFADGHGEFRGQRNGFKAFWLRDDFFNGDKPGPG